ncbi:Hypothetical protein D9617_6g092680 [Elsinoe fawcettii]|nr:Hypothetical protein D9617_6g092680 [Elsinoe fawcettii]
MTTSTIPDAATIVDKAKYAADLQSENFQQAAATIGKKMEEHPEAITAKDASIIKSAEAKHTGVAQPPKGTLSSEAEHLAALNAKATGADKASPIDVDNKKA